MSIFSSFLNPTGLKFYIHSTLKWSISETFYPANYIARY